MEELSGSLKKLIKESELQIKRQSNDKPAPAVVHPQSADDCLEIICGFDLEARQASFYWS
jgi:hypothetical protein